MHICCISIKSWTSKQLNLYNNYYSVVIVLFTDLYTLCRTFSGMGFIAVLSQNGQQKIILIDKRMRLRILKIMLFLNISVMILL